MSPVSPSFAVLEDLAAVIESRKAISGGNPDTSYVARLLARGPDAFLKKIGEEATEVVMASKDLDHAQASGTDIVQRRASLVGEVADLWFHCLIALAHHDLSPSDVLAELQRRAGTSGIEEKALRKALAREQDVLPARHVETPHG